MLSIFPELLSYSWFAALLVRVALSGVFAYSAWSRIPDERPLLKIFGVIDAIIAVSLLGGAYTQLIAIAAALCTAVWLLTPSIRPVPWSTAALALVMSLSLLLTGAGPFAFDLPL